MSPDAIGSAGLGATAGGGILSMFGAIDSGIANSKMYKYNAAIAGLNQQIDKQDAEFALETGREQNLAQGLKQGAQLGQEKAAMGASGFAVRSGSNAQVIQSQQTVNRLDSDMIRSNAAKTAYNYELQGTVAGAQGQMYNMAASNAMSAGLISAGSSFLGTAASVSSEWLQGQKVGLWNSQGGSGGGGGSGTSNYWQMFS